MPEMAHDWINKSILFYSVLFYRIRLLWMLHLMTNSDIYLRNKEKQQTLRVIVNIQYDASFLVQMIFIYRSSMCSLNYSRFNVIIDYVIILVCT